jgi:hypothetical protein
MVLLQGHNMTNQPFREYTSDPNQITNDGGLRPDLLRQA